MSTNRSIPVIAIFFAVLISAGPLAAQSAVSSAPKGTAAPTGTKTQAPVVLPESQAYKKADQALVSYFKTTVMKTQDFIDTFGADIKWEDISQSVIDSVDISRDVKDEKNRFGDAVYYFIGTVYDDYYVEITIDKITGEPKILVFEYQL